MSEPILRDIDHLIEVLDVDFSPEQRAAIVAPLEPGVIMAGAGTGKTTVMAARVVWLVGRGEVRADEVLGLTFTRKAAAELGQRIAAALRRLVEASGDTSFDAGDVTTATYDSFAGSLVKNHGLRIGVDSDARLITGASTYQLAARVVTSATGPFEQLGTFKAQTVVGRLLRLDADLQSHLCSLDRLRDHDERVLRALDQIDDLKGDLATMRDKTVERLELAGLVGEYRALKRRLGLVEFADQMAYAARIVDEVDAVPTLLRAQYRVVLLDEYQDTSAAQALVLRGLFSGPTTETGRGHAVTAVGDPHQAIYGWRGAAASNMTDFATMFPKADGSPATGFPLTINRRSGARILEVANSVASDLMVQTAHHAGPLVPAEGKDPGAVAAASFEVKQDETAWVADQVVHEHASGVGKWSDIAILVRRNADVPALFDALVDRDVPVEIVGLGGLLHLPEIADIVATLRLCLDPTANGAAATLLTGPRWRVPASVVATLTRRAKAIAQPPRVRHADVDLQLKAVTSPVDGVEQPSLVEAIADPGDIAVDGQIAHRLETFAREINELRDHVAEPVPEFVRRVVRTIGVEAEIDANPRLHRAGRRAQLDAFMASVNEFTDVDGTSSLPGLLAYFEAELDSGQGLEQAVPSDADSVKIMTVHRAKGLEWAVCFLPSLVDGVFPNERVTDNWTRASHVIPAALRGDAASVAQLGELTKVGLEAYKLALKDQQRASEDRLAYVAVTRAKQSLIATTHVWNPANREPRQTSPYFNKVLDEATRQQRVPHSAEPRAKGDPNPFAALPAEKPWPVRPSTDDDDMLTAAAARVTKGAATGQPDGVALMSAEDAAQVAAWADESARLIADEQARRRRSEVLTLPESLSASALIRAQRDPARYARETTRPMPRPATAAATLGSRFHEWVEQHFAMRSMIEPELGLETPSPEGNTDNAFEALKSRFLAGPYAERVPAAVEVPFVLLVGEHQVRGRIDAVYELPAGSSHRYQVVDWKTTDTEADRLQLACYRIAWAQAVGVSPDEVDAVFYHVRSGEVINPASLPEAGELERLVTEWQLHPTGRQ